MTARLDRGWVGDPSSTIAFIRRRGSDDFPTVVALHQTPLSSWTYRPFLERSRHPGTIIALDSPGYGDSDPLTTDANRSKPPALEDFATRVHSAIEALVPSGDLVLIGQHTGAHLAMMIAPALGGRVQGCIFQGLTLYTEEERADRAANYAPWITPSADGSHLSAIWERIGRLYPSADLRLRDRMVRDYLAADPGYPYAYLGVFAFDVAPAVARFKESGIRSTVIIGAQDLVAPRQHRVVEAFGSESILLDGLTDHAVSEDPDRFAATVDAWLVGLDEGTSRTPRDPGSTRPE